MVQSDDGSGDLRIKNVQIWHEGRYTCTTQTVVDNDTAYADLKVVGQSLNALPQMIVVAEIFFILDHILVVWLIFLQQNRQSRPSTLQQNIALFVNYMRNSLPICLHKYLLSSRGSRTSWCNPGGGDWGHVGEAVVD